MKKQVEESYLDYRKYHMTSKEYLIYGIQYLLLICLSAYVFYRSYFALILLLPCMIILLKRKKRQLCEQREEQLRIEFKETITTVSSGLSAGYSIENAFIEAAQDIEMLYGEQGLMTKELIHIKKRLSTNQTLESCLKDLADRSSVDDIKDFTAVFAAAKRNSGSLVSVISNTVSIINDKADIQREITVLISAKQLEQKIMNTIPFFIVLYVGKSTDGLLDMLYHNIAGVIIMSVCLLVYVLAIMLSERIVDIRV